MNSGRAELGVTQFGQEIAKVYAGSSCAVSSELFGFGGGKSNDRLEMGRPVDETATEIEDIAGLGFGGIDVFATEGGVGISFHSKSTRSALMEAKAEGRRTRKVANAMVESFETILIRVRHIATQFVNC